MPHPNEHDRNLPISALTLLAFLLSILVHFACPYLSVAEPLNDGPKLRTVMAMYADYRDDFPGIGEIDAAEAILLVGHPDVVFVDVRDPEEQAVSMVPGAVTSEVFLAAPDLYRGQRIIAYCTISYRSGKLAAKLKRKGVTIVNLEGGLLAWVHAGGPVVRGSRPVQVMHVYGRKWDLAPKGFQTIY